MCPPLCPISHWGSQCSAASPAPPVCPRAAHFSRSRRAKAARCSHHEEGCSPAACSLRGEAAFPLGIPDWHLPWLTTVNKGLRGKSYLQRRVMETFTMQCLELSSGCSQEKVAGWEPGHKHNGAGGATVRSYLNNHWVFINSFYNTDHSRAEVLVTFISVSNASQQLSHPEMLVATWSPQSELWKSVPNECIIGHQKSSVTFMFPHPVISFLPADSVMPTLSWPVRLWLDAYGCRPASLSFFQIDLLCGKEVA